MTDEAPVPPVPPGAAPPSTGQPLDRDQPNTANPPLPLHPRRYGWFRWALVLGILLAAAGATAVWFAMPPLYEVVGSVQVKPFLVLVPAGPGGVVPTYEAFVNLQVSLLQSQRVRDQADQNPDWRAVAQKSGHAGTNIDPHNLKVEHSTGSELVTVGYTDRDPAVAAVAVKSILQAYMAINDDAEATNDARRLQILEQLRTSLANQKRGIDQQIVDLAAGFGPDQLQSQYQFKLQEQNSLEVELQRIAVQISLAQATSGGGGGTATTGPAPESRDAPAPPAAPDSGGHGLALAELRARQASIRAMFDKVQADAKALGEQDMRVRDLKQQRDAISQKLAQVSTRIDQLNLESTLSNRITILSYGDRPTAPVPSKRILLMLAAAFLGLLAGAGLGALRGLTLRRH